MSPSQILLTGSTVVAMAAGQILFKLAADGMRGPGTWIQHIVLNRYLAAALVVYAGATALWIALLRQIPLQMAYPFVALAYFLVPLMAHLFLNEPLRWQSLVGALVIVLGVWISVAWD